MNLLLVESSNIGSLIFIGLLLVILVISPIILRVKNKRDMETAQKMLDSLKKGDEVLTSAGVIGKVISIDTKVGYKTVTIETGDEKHKGYQTLDINAIYLNLSAVPQEQAQVAVKEETKEEIKEEKVEELEKEVAEDAPAQPVEEVKEKPAKEKKTKTKKSSKK